MRFAASSWLFGALFALVVAALFVAGAVGHGRALARFGELPLVARLRTWDPSSRRAVKGVLVVAAVALAFVALARPQVQKGQRLIPATNLDVVLVVDFSKSMYARDVAPSRIGRAKAEVSRLVKELPGARFGAVAFAGEPIGFPLTSDGAAIAQFLKQMEPNEMPVGGTAIARALERAREILARDPRSKDHRRVIVLVTDGEDLEGDPISVSESIAKEGTTVHVVQIGGKTPERIPEVGADGQITGYRLDEQGRPLTTQLTAEGEAQLARTAQVGGGRIVRSERGKTGLEEMTKHLRAMMTEELSERVETVYEDEYRVPLALVLLLLIADTLLGEAPKKRRQEAGGEA